MAFNYMVAECKMCAQKTVRGEEVLNAASYEDLFNFVLKGKGLPSELMCHENLSFTHVMRRYAVTRLLAEGWPYSLEVDEQEHQHVAYDKILPETQMAYDRMFTLERGIVRVIEGADNHNLGPAMLIAAYLQEQILDYGSLRDDITDTIAAFPSSVQASLMTAYTVARFGRLEGGRWHFPPAVVELTVGVVKQTSVMTMPQVAYFGNREFIAYVGMEKDSEDLPATMRNSGFDSRTDSYSIQQTMTTETTRLQLLSQVKRLFVDVAAQTVWPILVWGASVGKNDQYLMDRLGQVGLQVGQPWPIEPHQIAERVKDVSVYLGSKRISTYLDFGCGDGRLAKGIHTYLTSHGRPHVTAEGYDPLYKGKHGVAMVDSLVERRYDLITCFMSCHHVTEKEWEMIAHSLKPGGLLILREHAIELTSRDFLDAYHLLIQMFKYGIVDTYGVLSTIGYRSTADWKGEFEDRGIPCVAVHHKEGPTGVCYLAFTKEVWVEGTCNVCYDGETTEEGYEKRSAYYTKTGVRQPYFGEVLDGSRGEPRKRDDPLRRGQVINYGRLRQHDRPLTALTSSLELVPSVVTVCDPNSSRTSEESYAGSISSDYPCPHGCLCTRCADTNEY